MARKSSPSIWHRWVRCEQGLRANLQVGALGLRKSCLRPLCEQSLRANLQADTLSMRRAGQLDSLWVSRPGSRTPPR